MTVCSSIQDVFNKSETKLSKLISQAQAIEALQQTFTSILDTELIPYCRVGCYESGILTLFAQSAATATRLRYHVPTLMSQLRVQPTWAGLCSIQIKVQTWQDAKPVETTPAPESPPLKLSGDNAKQIQALAESFKGQPGMEKLVESLERIARNREE